jgi:transposase
MSRRGTICGPITCRVGGAWRGEGKLVLPALPEPEADCGSAFAPIVIAPLTEGTVEPGVATLEIVCGGVVIRLDASTPADRIAGITRALNGAS